MYEMCGNGQPFTFCPKKCYRLGKWAETSAPVCNEKKNSDKKAR